MTTIQESREQSVRLVALAVALCGAMFACPTPTRAQTPPPEGKDAQAIDEVVVTGSRISRAGFDAPTPMTVVGADDIARQGAPNIADVLNQLPAFRANAAPTSTALNSGGAGVNILNLRGLGASRTLVLINGRRHVATSATGAVNTNLIPQALIERVEVVTGGASAAWGSDAVAGVVNFVYDDKFEGLQGSAQMGIAEEGDNRESRGALAYGTGFLDGRGHFAIAGELFDGDGIDSQTDRDWGRAERQVIANPAFAPGNGQPRLLVAQNVHQSNRSEGGLILNGRFAGMQFAPGGALVPFAFGSPRNANFMVGGDGTHQGNYASLNVPLSRQSFSTITSYDITDDIRAVVEGSFGRSNSRHEVTQSFNLAPYTIASASMALILLAL